MFRRKKIPDSSFRTTRVERVAGKDATGSIRTIAIVLLLMLGQWSQVTAGERSDGSSEKISFDIPRQRADLALVEFAQQADVTFIFPFEEARRETANRLVGHYAREEAIRILLANTGLQPAFDEHGALAVHISDTNTRRGNAMDRTTNRSGKRSLASVVAAILSVFSGQRASGQEVQGSDSADTVAAARLEEVVVTAQKRAERLQDVPISITVLSGAELDSSTSQGITEALTQVPGVAAISHSQGGGTLVTVRGVTASGPLFGGSSPIAYYLDSVPFGLVQTAIAPDANAYDLERVEVLRGPQGTLYGANAQNGVVRVLTNDANANEFEFKARSSLSSTEQGGENYRGDAALNLPIVEGKLAARAVLGYEDLSGWIDQPIKRDANDSQLRNARLKINAHPTDELSIDAFAWLSRQDHGAPSYSDDQWRTASLINESTAIDYDAYGVEIVYDLPGLSITSMTSYLDYTNDGTVDLINENAGGSLELFTGFAAHVFSQEINLTSRSAGPWRWTAGGIFRDGKDKNFQAIPDIFVGGWTNTSRSFAVFGELSHRFHGDRLEWTVGGRYFHDEVVSKEDPDAPPSNPPLYYRQQDSFHSTTPRAVLTWFATDDLTAYGSYSEGFRSGTPQAYTAAGLPALKPDELHNYELGAKGNLLDGRIFVDTAVFYTEWKDVQQQLTVPFVGIPNGVTGLVNAASASGIGFELGVTTRPLDGLELGVNVSWNDLTVDSDVISGGAVLFAKGDRLNFSPEYTAGASADYVRSIGGDGFEMRLAASANYTSVQGFRTVTGGSQSLAFGDPMLIARTSVSVRSPAHWDVTVFIDNVNNEKGPIYGNPFAGVPLPFADVRVRPRTIGLQLEYRH